MPPEEDPNKPPVTGGGDNGGDADKDAGAKSALVKERARAAKAEADAKTARDELARLQATISEGKTDGERMTAKLVELEARANEADMRAMRAEVAQSKGLTAAQAKRLQGKTVDELEADADELLSAFKPAEGDGAATDAGNGAGATRRTAGRPQEALRPGATPPSDQGAEYDSKAFLAALPRG
jgi:hypothetical protein